MTRVRRHLSYANVISTLCLFLVLGGGSAYALSGSNTVFSDDIVDGQVRTADILNGDVRNPDLAPDSVQTGKVLNGNLTGLDIANNSLKGADIDEASLAGALIPGIATSGLVKSSGVVGVDDPANVTLTPLLTAGPFTVTGQCEDNDHAIAFITSSVDTWVAGTGTDLDLTFTAPGSTFQVATATVASGDVLDVSDYAAAAPSKFLAGEVLAGVDVMGKDCVFGVTGIG
jgi:hypothetical protein